MTTIDQFPDSDGNMTTILWADDKAVLARVDHLVWEAFRGPIPEGHSIDHVDGDKANCALSNLRLVKEAL